MATKKATEETAVEQNAEMQSGTASAAVTEQTTETRAPLTAAAMDAEARSMKEVLNERPKVRVKLLDRAAAEKGIKKPPHPVSINGYVFNVPWNTPVEVPDRVAEILEAQGLI